jgi:hypothetical protein
MYAADMSKIVAIPSNDDRVPFDDALAEAVVDGTADKDMPEPYRSLAQLFATLRSPAEATERRDAEAAVTEIMRAARHDHIASTRRSPMIRKFTVKTVVVASALTVLTAGAAAAAGLPGAAQDAAVSALAKAGISVPGTDDHSGDHANTRGQSGEDHASIAEDSATSEDDSDTSEEATTPSSLPEQAAEIVSIATDSSLSGPDKGAAVSAVASDGHSRAGTDHQTPDTLTHRSASAPADLPAGPPADVPAGPPASAPAGPPADVPAGPPADVPAGPPASLPAAAPVAPPVSVPVEPPVDTPAGPPAGVPDGPPVSLPVTPPHP